MIGKWVLDAALRQAKQWELMGLPPITVAVNVSPIEFHEEGFTERIAAHGVPPGLLELEITESIVLRDVEGAKKLLNELHALEVKLAMDDFGTGYSSLSYLRDFSVDKLKIDKSFIAESADPRIGKLIRAIVAFAHSLDIRTNAEGVGYREQLDLLRLERCDEIQGYVASHPLPAGELEKLLRNWRPLA
jgi:EAL domain-containing protein (putative c-di-GMP-specific phosphodiesterase class I)